MEKETEKQQPLEKQRHYEPESIRQFMAKQKAERQRRREEAKKAEEEEMRKRMQHLQDLMVRQKTAVLATKVMRKLSLELL